MYSVQAFILISCSSMVLATVELVGHQLPFGNHRRPSVEIDQFTVENAPRPQDFYEKYFKQSKAAIFRGAVTNSKAYTLWTDDYIREKYGENEVRMEGKNEKKDTAPVGEKYLGRDTLRHFVDTYHEVGNSAYIVSDLPRDMYHDVDVLPSFGACGQMAKRIVEVDIWWSGGGSNSIIHKDAYNQINCLLNGTKYWKLIEYKYEKNLYKHDEGEEAYGGFSDVNPKRVDLVRFPMVKDIEWSNITINAGDCLFLPKSYYHQVSSTGTNNLAVSLLISRFDEGDENSLDFSDCTNQTDYKVPRTLDNYDVQLVWNGTGAMVMGGVDLEYAYRRDFLSLAVEYKNQGILLDYEEWKTSYINEDRNIIKAGEPKIAFDVMDKNGDGYIVPREIESLTLQDLQTISRQLETYEPSNHYTFEYSFMAFENLWKLINQVKKEIKVLSPARWESIYTEEGGTKNFANEIFIRLAKGKEDIFMHEVKPIDIWNALENWITYWVPQYSNLKERPTKRAFGIEDYDDDSHDEL